MDVLEGISINISYEEKTIYSRQRKTLRFLFVNFHYFFKLILLKLPVYFVKRLNLLWSQRK